MIFKIILEELNEWFEAVFIRNTPGKFGRFLRWAYWRKRFLSASAFSIGYGCIIENARNISLEKGVRIMNNCHIFAQDGSFISIGEDGRINRNVILGASNKEDIKIGSNVMIGPNVVFRTANHKYDKKDIPMRKQGHIADKIIVEDDVWIGANAVILQGVTIGKGSIVGAGAVVTKDIPSYSMVGGVPAKVIKENFRV